MDDNNLLELLHQLDHIDDDGDEYDGAALIEYDGRQYYVVDIVIDHDPAPDNRRAHYHYVDGFAHVHAHEHNRLEHIHLEYGRPDLIGCALFERGAYDRATHRADDSYHGAPVERNPWSAFYRVGN